jgi:hypothetical protein
MYMGVPTIKDSANYLMKSDVNEDLKTTVLNNFQIPIIMRGREKRGVFQWYLSNPYIHKYICMCEKYSNKSIVKRK